VTAQIIPFPTPARALRRHHETLGDVVVEGMARHQTEWALLIITKPEGRPRHIEIACAPSLSALTKRAADAGHRAPEPPPGAKVYVIAPDGRGAWFTLEKLALAGRFGGTR
jgi:hypothetical protein